MPAFLSQLLTESRPLTTVILSILKNAYSIHIMACSYYSIVCNKSLVVFSGICCHCTCVRERNSDFLLVVTLPTLPPLGLSTVV